MTIVILLYLLTGATMHTLRQANTSDPMEWWEHPLWLFGWYLLLMAALFTVLSVDSKTE